MTDAKKTMPAATRAKSESISNNKNEGESNKAQSGSDASSGDAETLLKADHRKVEQLFQQFEGADDAGKKKQLVRQVCLELIVHTKLEEEIFYPACREKGVEHEMLDEAQVEHDGAKMLIGELLNGSPDDEYYDAKVTVLSEYIKHHVAEEEQPKDGIFAAAREEGVDMSELGMRIQSRKSELMARSDALLSRAPQPRSLHNPAFKGRSQGQQEFAMARYSNDRDRDEYGRFTSDDDDRRGPSRGGYSSRGRNDDDDNRGYRGNDRPRDDDGRFMSEEGGRSGGGPSRSRYDDDSRSRDGNRGHGGWFGDSEGHSETARSRGTSSRYRDDDDNRGSDRGGGSGHGGWFGDSRGHSEASREGWESRGASGRGSQSRYDRDDERNGGNRGDGRGWYGDPRGHSEASREGWEHRGSSRSSSARGRNDYDDDRGGRGSRTGGGGHGGWFGDSRGHSEASRRGWEDR
jgi:hypothetical protein